MLGRLGGQAHTYLGGRSRNLIVEFDQMIPLPAQDLLNQLQGVYGNRLQWAVI